MTATLGDPILNEKGAIFFDKFLFYDKIKSTVNLAATVSAQIEDNII